jgi:hypothetical protein
MGGGHPPGLLRGGDYGNSPAGTLSQMPSSYDRRGRAGRLDSKGLRQSEAPGLWCRSDRSPGAICSTAHLCLRSLLGHFLLSSLGDGQDKTGRQCRSAYVASPRLTGTNSRTRYYCCGLKCTVVGPRQVSQERDTRPSSPSKRPTEIEPSPSGVRMRRLRERWSQNCVSERRVTACQSSALALDGAPPGGDSKSDEALPDTDRGPRRADYEAREPNQPPARIRRVRRDRCGDRPGRRLRSGQGIATDVTSPSTLRRSHAAPWSSDSVGPSKWSPPNGTARRGTAPTSSF